MADDIDLKLAEIDNENKKIALEAEREKTAQAAAAARGRKSEGWLKFVIGGVIGAAAAYGTAYLEYSGKIKEAEFVYQNRDREIDLELAKLSLTILSGDYDENEVEKSLPARMFALRALSVGTGVEISPEDMDTWAKTGVTPAAKDDLWGLFGPVTSGNDNFAARKRFKNESRERCIVDDEGDRICGPFSRFTGPTTGCVWLLQESDGEGFGIPRDVCGLLTRDQVFE
ncbi:hypothetical protein [Ruegeria atlantica]|uniref:hypothetical protein n=1 Tax=Ruegeria atlantica TaxID=81569 RepID=UPI00147C8613|nr:hypothetical protein [Ruegeria atlantica]